MGCDIHICVQVQEDGVWKEVPYQEVYHYEGARKAVPGTPICPRVFRNRNYDLFAVLANVRNGIGFAGIKTGEGWPSIAPNRGWPDDFDELSRLPNAQYPEDGPGYMGDHSFTWVSLDELKAFPWDATVTKLCGPVKAESYEKLKAVGDSPTENCGGISGPGIVEYEPEDYERAKRDGMLAPEPYVRMSWDESARSATYDWPGKVIPWLEELAAGRPLRLVLGFDS